MLSFSLLIRGEGWWVVVEGEGAGLAGSAPLGWPAWRQTDQRDFCFLSLIISLSLQLFLSFSVFHSVGASLPSFIY
jgi:hypothetical protein